MSDAKLVQKSSGSSGSEIFPYPTQKSDGAFPDFNMSNEASEASSAGVTDAEPVTANDVEELLNEKDLVKAQALKDEGNSLFGDGDWSSALERYSAGLLFCPDDQKDLLAILFNNRGACHIMLKDWAQAVSECSASLQHKPDWTKALARRAKAFEEMDRLFEALEDWKIVFQKEPTNKAAQQNVRRLEPIVAERTEKQKEEVLGKLKDLGNTLLGKFGLSLDNFKATKDPSTGSYNISFGQ